MKEPTGIPAPIRNFFSEPSARSLLVKGASGTGKTTFVLQLIEDILPLDTSIYFSTRVSDEALYSHFKWLKEKEWRESILDASKEMLKVMRATSTLEEIEQMAEKREILDASKDFLSTIYPSEEPQRAVQRSRLDNLCENYALRELEKLYDSLERKLPARCYVVVDSLEGISEKWDGPVTKIMSALQKALVERTNVCVAAVIEGQGDTSLDFLVDGTMTLYRSEMDNHFIRELEIHKLRGVLLKTSRWLCTLHEGHFRLLPHHPALERIYKGPAKVVPDSDVGYSTGRAGRAPGRWDPRGFEGPARGGTVHPQRRRVHDHHANGHQFPLVKTGRDDRPRGWRDGRGLLHQVLATGGPCPPGREHARGREDQSLT